MFQGQGIFDEFKDAFRKPNNDLAQIILINVAVWVVIRLLEVIFRFAQSPGIFEIIMDQLVLPSPLERVIFKPWTLITYFFTHYGLFHILFNMLFLYWFGKIIVEFLGSKKLVSLYVLGGISGGIIYLIVYNIFYQNQPATMLGASAGVMAIVVGAATFNPNYTFYLLLFGPVRIKYIAIFYVFLSFIETIGSNPGGNWAHLGGAFIGFIYVRQLQKGNDVGSWIISSLDFIKSFFVSTPKVKVSYRKPGGKPGSKGHSSQTPQEEIDTILDKISESGYESLTREEKDKLFNASKK